MNEEQEKEILNEAKIQTARHKKKIQIINLVAIIAVIAMATVACIPLIKALHSKAGIAALERKLLLFHANFYDYYYNTTACLCKGF